MLLECTCADITPAQRKRKMKGFRPINYQWLVGRIKKHLPQLYEALSLDLSNPYGNLCGTTREYYILCHSATEYFIKK